MIQAVAPAVATSIAPEPVSTTQVKAKQPAKVSLTSFVLYRLNGRVGDPKATAEVLYGGQDVRITPEGKLQLLAANVPFHSKRFALRGPKLGYGMLALYGHRDALEELQFWRAKARALGCEFAYANYDVEVGRIFETLVDRKMLREGTDARFLNLRRAKDSLQTEIFERFRGYATAEGDQASMTAVSQIATRPDFYDQLFVDDKDLRHLSVFVTPIADNEDIPGKVRQVAYIRSGANVLNIVQGSDHVDVLLPAWLTDEAYAKKERARNKR